MALPISYIIGVVSGVLVFAIIIASIFTSIYLLFAIRKVIKNVPDEFKKSEGGVINNGIQEKQSRTEDGSEGRSWRWFGWFRRRRTTERRDEVPSPSQRRVEVQPVVPYPEVDGDSTEPTRSTKQDWPSFD